MDTTKNVRSRKDLAKDHPDKEKDEEQGSLSDGEKYLKEIARDLQQTKNNLVQSVDGIVSNGEKLHKLLDMSNGLKTYSNSVNKKTAWNNASCIYKTIWYINPFYSCGLFDWYDNS